jgi:mono/diheme cytochrome c family protein
VRGKNYCFFLSPVTYYFLESILKQLALIITVGVFFVVGSGAARLKSSLVQNSDAAKGARDAAAIFNGKCATCHGKDGRAKTFKAKFNGARNLADADWQESVTDERIFNSIANGRGKKMPAFSQKLSQAEIESLVTHVRGLKR